MKYVNIINLMIICGIYTGIEGFFRRSSKIYSTARPFLTRKVGVSRLHTGKKTYSTFSTPTKLDLTRKKSAGLIKELADERQAVDATLARIRKQEQTWQKRYHDTQPKSKPEVPPKQKKKILVPQRFFSPAPKKRGFWEAWRPRARQFSSAFKSRARSGIDAMTPLISKSDIAFAVGAGATAAAGTGLVKWAMQERTFTPTENLARPSTEKETMQERTFTSIENVARLSDLKNKEDKKHIIQTIINDLNSDTLHEYMNLFNKAGKTATYSFTRKLFQLGIDHLFMKLASLVNTPEQAKRLDYILYQYNFMNYNQNNDIQKEVMRILAHYNPNITSSIVRGFLMYILPVFDTFKIVDEKELIKTLSNIIEFFPHQSKDIYNELSPPARTIFINKLLELRPELAKKYIETISSIDDKDLQQIAVDIYPKNKQTFDEIVTRIMPPTFFSRILKTIGPK